MKHSVLIILFVTFIIGCSKPELTLLDHYTTEILALKTEAEIDAYWDNLQYLDQNALKTGRYSVIEQDSISITHMMRTALMFEIHGVKAYKLNNIVPEMHFTHNNFGPSSLVFWPIIKACVKVRGNTKIFDYPAYQLEGITNNFYDYSIYGQKEKYNSLISKLEKIESDKVSHDLMDVLNYQKSLLDLKELKYIGKWFRQQIKGLNESDYFEFVKMSNGETYCKEGGRLQKLELIKSEKNSISYRIEKEPFGWSYKLKNNGDLSLIDDKETVLINYSKHKL